MQRIVSFLFWIFVLITIIVLAVKLVTSWVDDNEVDEVIPEPVGLQPVPEYNPKTQGLKPVPDSRTGF